MVPSSGCCLFDFARSTAGVGTSPEAFIHPLRLCPSSPIPLLRFGLFDEQYEHNMKGGPKAEEMQPRGGQGGSHRAAGGAAAGGAGLDGEDDGGLGPGEVAGEPPPGPPPPPMSDIGKAALASLYNPGSWGGRRKMASQ